MNINAINARYNLCHVVGATSNITLKQPTLGQYMAYIICIKAV